MSFVVRKLPLAGFLTRANGTTLTHSKATLTYANTLFEFSVEHDSTLGKHSSRNASDQQLTKYSRFDISLVLSHHSANQLTIQSLMSCSYKLQIRQKIRTTTLLCLLGTNSNL